MFVINLKKLVLNFQSDEMKIINIMDKSQGLKILPLLKFVNSIPQETWDYGSLKSNVNYFYPPRFLIVEVKFIIIRISPFLVTSKDSPNLFVKIFLYKIYFTKLYS